MKVFIKKSENIISKEANYKREYFEIITKEMVLFLTYKIEGNKVTAL